MKVFINCLSILISLILCTEVQAKDLFVDTVPQVIDATKQLKPGDTLTLADGVYKDIKWVIPVSGNAENPIVIRANNGGKVSITGNSNVELRGSFIVFDGLVFKDGNRIPSQWKSHGPGLIAIYGSYNRVTNCVVDDFDNVKSAYLTTFLDSDGGVPVHCRVDHCSFLNKKTQDQVINLNNRIHKRSSTPAPPMYHRIDHCLISSPYKKKGNAGGGIRIGYYRNDLGRCLVDSNLFVRQNSEPEIITSKCQENVIYANTFIDCRGTTNLRHGDKQVLLNNFFIAKSDAYGCGGIFIWGANHLIACNYFELNSTLKTRGNAAIYLNPGPASSNHALAKDLFIVNNLFVNNNGYAIHTEPLKDRREKWAAKNNLEFKLPFNIAILGNVFFQHKYFENDFIYTSQSHKALGSFKGNFYRGSGSGLNGNTEGMKKKKFSMKDEKLGLKKRPAGLPLQNCDYPNIQGIYLDLSKLVSEGVKGAPLKKEDVGPSWNKKF
ncbi:hypothetical protein K4L44_10445 [Halosquirtibacter laminarini]|uniref:Uncharacterized protein n=1 Tax=Halosquirtibacter laminarini TaxID=3374600 RepID=A0AC61NLE6_9BACT|nr:hypothetical protein K4L44_10445 [Prolixibacteraceae bacterium]